jgi:hypothetical protein
MKHISQFTHNLEELQRFADHNGHIPETLKDLSAPYFHNFTNLDPNSEDDYDDLMLFLGSAQVEMARAEGYLASTIQAMAENVGIWKRAKD